MRIVKLKEWIHRDYLELAHQWVPSEIGVPATFLFNAAQLAQKVETNDKFISFDFSLEHLNYLSDEQIENLKPIQGPYPSDTTSQGDPALFQAVVDDNHFSSFMSVLTGYKFYYTVRNMTKNTELEPMLDLMVTDYFNFAIPDVVEEYGSGTKVDVTLNIAHESF